MGPRCNIENYSKGALRGAWIENPSDFGEPNCKSSKRRKKLERKRRKAGRRS